MVIDRNKHNIYVATGFQPTQQTTVGDAQQSGSDNTTGSSSSGSTGSSSTIVINGGGGMTSAQEEKLSGIEAGAQVNQNAYSNITILNGTVEAGTITAQVETDTAKISTITPLVCNLIDGVIQLTFDDTNYATKQYVIDSIDDLIGAAPGALDTLEELAQALGDDPNFATTVTNMIASVTSRVDTIEDTYAKLTDITIANITDLNSNWDSLLLNTPTDYITRWPNWGEITDKPTWIGDTKPTYTAEEIGALTQAAADNLYVSITGDTMQGPLTFQTSTEAYHKTGLLFNNDSSRIGCSTAGGIGIYAADGIYLRPNWVEDGTMYGVVLKSNTFTYNGYPILTSENYGQYIDIEAGGITQDIADSRYVNVTGDTMTGTLIGPNFYTTKGAGNRYSRLSYSGVRVMASPTEGAVSGMISYTNDENTLLGYIAGVWTELNQLNHYYFYGGTDFQNPYMIITPTGNVGIGTTSPTAKLSVNGDITVPYTKATADGSVPYAGSLIPNLTSLEQVSNYKSFIGGVTVNNTWYWGINVRHRNGYGDGNQYGLWIYTTLTAAGSLAYKKQQGTWTTERTLLDSVNYTNYTVTKTGVGASGSWPISITGSAGYTNYLFDRSIRCRTINKNDNSANPTWVLISNCSALFTSETAHGNYGFTGYCNFSRNGGYTSDGNALIMARIAYANTHVRLETSEGHIIPHIVKYNNNYYVAFRLAGSNSSYRLTGVWYNCVDSFTQLNADSSGNVSGLSIVNVGTTYASFNARSANSATQLLTARSLWGQSFNGTADIVGTLRTYTNGTGQYDQGIRINRTSAANWATLTIGYVGTATTGTSANTWLIGTPPNSNGLLFRNNGSTTTSGLFLAGQGNSDMKWNNNVVINAANIGSYNAGSATRLQTARTITLTGAVTGSTTFNGAANVTLATTMSAAASMSWKTHRVAQNLQMYLYNGQTQLLYKTISGTQYVYLPTLTEVRKTLGISASTDFAVQFIVHVLPQSTGTFRVTGRTSTVTGHNTAEYPEIRRGSGEVVGYLDIGSSGTEVYTLYYDSVSGYVAQIWVFLT